MDFEGRISVVTGASQGIGEAISLELSRAGADLILIDIQKEKLEEVAQKIQSFGRRAFSYTADVADSQQVTAVVEAILSDHKKIDHLVNNAGITRDSLLLRMKEADWDAVLAVNLKGVFNFSKAVVRSMLNNRYGRIVNISSVVGQMGNPGQANYAASKAGVVAFAKALAREVASRGITVNCVAPGYVATAMTERLPEDVKKAFIDLIPMRRFAGPDDVAHAVKFLLSDEAAYITGQVIHVNGGMYM